MYTIARLMTTSTSYSRWRSTATPMATKIPARHTSATQATNGCAVGRLQRGVGDQRRPEHACGDRHPLQLLAFDDVGAPPSEDDRHGSPDQRGEQHHVADAGERHADRPDRGREHERIGFAGEDVVEVLVDERETTREGAPRLTRAPNRRAAIGRVVGQSGTRGGACRAARRPGSRPTATPSRRWRPPRPGRGRAEGRTSRSSRRVRAPRTRRRGRGAPDPCDCRVDGRRSARPRPRRRRRRACHGSPSPTRRSRRGSGHATESTAWRVRPRPRR